METFCSKCVDRQNTQNIAVNFMSLKVPEFWEVFTDFYSKDEIKNNLCIGIPVPNPI